MKKESFIVAALGLWLLASPMTFGDECSKVCINEIVCGLLLMLVGFLSLLTEKKAIFKISALIGLWLQMAPLLFWAPEAVSYLNDTLVGMVLMLLVFSFPGISDVEKGGETPPNWSFNPSDLGPRRVSVFLALIAWFLARYLESYQLGYIDTVEDPFFGDGTLKVISSSIAKMFPVSDAGLGAFGYSLEFLLGLIGSSRRWKTMPWVTVFFGLMVIPAGMISILLIVLQPVLVGAWCGICLLIAVCMLIMVLLTIPEMAATIQLLLRAKKNRMFWSVFWRGDFSSPASKVQPIKRNGTSRFGFTISSGLVVSLLLGVWLMFSPSVFGDVHPAADSNYIAGPLLVAISFIAFSEVVRSFRFANLGISALLILSTCLLDGFTTLGFFNNIFVSLFVSLLVIHRESKRERYGESR